MPVGRLTLIRQWSHDSPHNAIFVDRLVDFLVSGILCLAIVVIHSCGFRLVNFATNCGFGSTQLVLARTRNRGSNRGIERRLTMVPDTPRGGNGSSCQLRS